MEEERATLRAAIVTIRRRIDDARAEIVDVQGASFAKTREAMEPVLAAIMDEARAAAEVLATAYARAEAIGIACRAGGDDRSRLRNAVAGSVGIGNLLLGRRAIDVPAEIVALLKTLTGNGAALPVRIPERVAAP